MVRKVYLQKSCKVTSSFNILSQRFKSKFLSRNCQSIRAVEACDPDTAHILLQEGRSILGAKTNSKHTNISVDISLSVHGGSASIEGCFDCACAIQKTSSICSSNFAGRMSHYTARLDAP